MNKEERQTFRKNERLCRIKLINEIFENGNVFYTPGFKAAWIIAGTDLPSPAQVAISIPKKIFRLAVTRNLIKRRIKEAYRKKKHSLYKFLTDEKIQIAFILIYRKNSIPDYTTAERFVTDAIEKLCDNVGQKLTKC
jgi:ribonuclease P protein component